jgi:hypothetical protein
MLRVVVIVVPTALFMLFIEPPIAPPTAPPTAGTTGGILTVETGTANGLTSDITFYTFF